MIRKAKISDPPALVELVNHFASRELMLPRSLNEVYEDLRDFFVWEEDGQICGCAALHVSWKGLGEIRSLAVREEYQGRGIGAELVEACLEEARELNMSRVFALTYEQDFFARFGFERFPKDDLPHKIWSDCLKCPKFPDCDEVAVMLELRHQG
jgi:amino-acid N-acetyltransferase